MPIIFISYRRDDTSGYAGRLCDRIRKEFGRENVFIDVDTLRPGDDFVDAINNSLEKCDLMLAVIGKRWLTDVDEQGRPRLRTRAIMYALRSKRLLTDVFGRFRAGGSRIHAAAARSP